MPRLEVFQNSCIKSVLLCRSLVVGIPVIIVNLRIEGREWWMNHLPPIHLLMGQTLRHSMFLFIDMEWAWETWIHQIIPKLGRHFLLSKYSSFPFSSPTKTIDPVALTSLQLSLSPEFVRRVLVKVRRCRFQDKRKLIIGWQKSAPTNLRTATA